MSAALEVPRYSSMNLTVLVYCPYPTIRSEHTMQVSGGLAENHLRRVGFSGAELTMEGSRLRELAARIDDPEAFVLIPTLEACDVADHLHKIVDDNADSSRVRFGVHLRE